MKKKVRSWIWLLLLGNLTPACAQLDSVLIREGVLQLCPRLSYPPDSLAAQASLDTIHRLLAGRWALRIIESGWAAAREAPVAVEVSFDSVGRGLIYEQGQLVASFDLTLRRLWGMVRFTLNQQGQSIIRLSLSKQSGGLLQVCEQKLFISDGMADGMLYAFRRLPGRR